MPLTRPLVDAEKLLVEYLKGVSELDGLVSDKISTKLPKEFTPEKRLRLFRVGGTPDPSLAVPWIDRPRMQLESYGSTKGEAFEVSQVAMDAIYQMPGTYEGAVVTAVTPDLGLQWRPDPHTEAPRYLWGVVLYVHPTEG